MENAEINRKVAEKLEILPYRIITNGPKLPGRKPRPVKIPPKIKNVVEKRVKCEILEKMNSDIYIFLNLNN